MSKAVSIITSTGEAQDIPDDAPSSRWTWQKEQDLVLAREQSKHEPRQQQSSSDWIKKLRQEQNDRRAKKQAEEQAKKQVEEQDGWGYGLRQMQQPQAAAMAPWALAPQAMAPQAMAPQAMAPQAMAPQAMQQAMRQQAMQQQAMAPLAMPPQAMAPQAMAPQAMAPQAMPPLAMPPWAMPPQVRAPPPPHLWPLAAATPYRLQPDAVEKMMSRTWGVSNAARAVSPQARAVSPQALPPPSPMSDTTRSLLQRECAYEGGSCGEHSELSHEGSLSPPALLQHSSSSFSECGGDPSG